MNLRLVRPGRNLRIVMAAGSLASALLVIGSSQAAFVGSNDNPGNAWRTVIPRITVTPTIIKGPFPRVLTGSLTSFDPHETVTYRLDATTILTGSPTAVGAGGSAAITTLSIPSTTDGVHTVYAIGGNGSTAGTTITVDTTAPTVTAALSPVANGNGWNNTSPVQVTLAANDGTGTGVNLVRYTTDGTDPTSSGTATTYTTPFTVAATTTVKYYATDIADNASTLNSQQVNIDTVAPTSGIALSNITGAYKSGNTVYYRGVAAGSFTLTNTITDATSGASASTTAVLAGSTAGWTTTPSTVSTPAGGPYVSNSFAWAAATSTAPTETITATDAAGNTSATNLTYVDDSTAPATGTLSYTNGYAGSASVVVTFTAGADAGSGVDTGAAALQRATATLSTAGTCGTFGAFSTVAAAPASPYPDTSVHNMRCYTYQYVAYDNVGNTSTTTSASTTKVSYTATVASTTGLAGYWRMAEPVLGYDSFTGIAGTTLPSHTAETGAPWTMYGNDTGVLALNGTGAVYRSVDGIAPYYSTGTPPTADYSVDADLVVKSMDLADEEAGLSSRIAGGTNDWTSYYGYYTHSGTGGTHQWVLDKVAADGFSTNIVAVATTALTVGSTHRIQLQVVGTSISFWVDGVQTLSGIDATITATGHPGLSSGYSTAATATTGLHLDNYRVTSRMADHTGASLGDYHSGTATGVTGALANDTDTAARFDGTAFAVVEDTTALHQSDTFSVEAWVKRADSATTVQTIANKGAGSYKVAFNNNRLTLYTSGGAAIATSTVTFTDTTAYHHYVVTKSGGIVKLYADSVDVTGTVTNAALTGTTTGLYLAGTSGTTERLNGTVDEVAIYSQALTAATVAAHYGLAS